MVYKVQSNFNNNLDMIIKKLSILFDIMYYNNVIYIGKKEFNNKVEVRTLLKPISSYYITEINIDNLKYEDPKVQEWCKSQLTKLDLQVFESEHQENIEEYMEILGTLDKELEKILKLKGGVII